MPQTPSPAHLPPETLLRDEMRGACVQCSACRWWYDMRNLNALMYHAYRDHEPPRRDAAAHAPAKMSL